MGSDCGLWCGYDVRGWSGSRRPSNQVRYDSFSQVSDSCRRVGGISSPSGPTGGCELPEGGRPCGVPAIGHCRTCHRAFCRTHQARAARGLENLLDSEFGSAAAAFGGYIDWCAACRSADFDKLDDKDKPALGQPFGGFLEERFFTSDSRSGASVDTSAGKAVNDLVARADRALGQYPYDPVLPWVEEVLQLCDGHAVDGSVRAEGVERLIRICTKFSRGSDSRGGGGYCAPLIRYTDIEEVGISRMESMAGSLKRYFPPQPLPEEKAPAKKAAKRRWFY